MPWDRRGLVFESLRVAEMEIVKGIPTASCVTDSVVVALAVAFSQRVVMRMKMRTRAGNGFDGENIVVEREKAVAGGGGTAADAGALLEGEIVRRTKGPTVFVQLKVVVSAQR